MFRLLEIEESRKYKIRSFALLEMARGLATVNESGRVKKEGCLYGCTARNINYICPAV